MKSIARGFGMQGFRENDFSQCLRHSHPECADVFKRGTKLAALVVQLKVQRRRIRRNSTAIAKSLQGASLASDSCKFRRFDNLAKDVSGPYGAGSLSVAWSAKYFERRQFLALRLKDHLHGGRRLDVQLKRFLQLKVFHLVRAFTVKMVGACERHFYVSCGREDEMPANLMVN